MSERPIWKMPSGDWLQDLEKKRYFILKQESGETWNNQSGLEIIAGAKWHRKSQSECAGFFPPEFDHCPYCGLDLTPSDHQSDVWAPPYGDGSGIRLVSKPVSLASLPIKQENALRWIEQEKEVFPLPRLRGDFQFIVAPLGTQYPVLVAFDRTSGLLDYFSPAEKKWIPLKPAPGRRIGESRLPNWSWAASFVNGRAGFSVPTRESPVWVGLDWEKGAYTPVFGTGECIGGSATLGNQVFVPVLTAEEISIAGFDFAKSQWVQIGEPDQRWNTTSGRNGVFSVPVVDEGRIYWIGLDGLLTFTLSDRTCKWRPWETDPYPCKAVPELGPPYRDPSGHFWQICYDDHDESYRYYKLSGEESDREDVDGGHFTSGISCFSKKGLYSYDVWEEPWKRMDAKRQDKERYIRVPLLCLDEKSKSTVTAYFGSGSNLPLLDIVKDREQVFQLDLRIESPGSLPVDLKITNAFNLQAPWELRMFVYQNSLFVHSMKEGICLRWRMK